MQIQICERCRSFRKTDRGWVFLTGNDLADLLRHMTNTITWSLCAACLVRKEGGGDDKDHCALLSVQGSCEAERALDEDYIRRIQGD